MASDHQRSHHNSFDFQADDRHLNRQNHFKTRGEPACVIRGSPNSVEVTTNQPVNGGSSRATFVSGLNNSFRCAGAEIHKANMNFHGMTVGRWFIVLQDPAATVPVGHATNDLQRVERAG